MLVMPRRGKRRRNGEGNNQQTKPDDEPDVKKLRGYDEIPISGV